MLNIVCLCALAGAVVAEAAPQITAFPTLNKRTNVIAGKQGDELNEFGVSTLGQFYYTIAPDVYALAVALELGITVPEIVSQYKDQYAAAYTQYQGVVPESAINIDSVKSDTEFGIDRDLGFTSGDQAYITASPENYQKMLAAELVTGAQATLVIGLYSSIYSQFSGVIPIAALVGVLPGGLFGGGDIGGDVPLVAATAPASEVTDAIPSSLIKAQPAIETAAPESSELLILVVEPSSQVLDQSVLSSQEPTKSTSLVGVASSFTGNVGEVSSEQQATSSQQLDSVETASKLASVSPTPQPIEEAGAKILAPAYAIAGIAMIHLLL